MDAATPQLSVRYSPELDLLIACIAPDIPDFATFEVKCRILYPGGHFECESGGLLFSVRDFVAFADGLGKVRQGNATSAVLKNPAGEFVFELVTADRIHQRVHLKVSAQEYVGGTDPVTAQFALYLDYDLYVNRLFEAMAGFIRDLRRFCG